MRLEDKIVLITGASTGIGRALARGLAGEGAHVVVNHLADRAGAQALIQEITRFGRQALAVQADLRRVAQIRRMFDQVRRQFGRLDVLINNAAVTGWSAILETTEAQFDQVLDTNLKGAFFCSIEAARLMKDQGGGVIINVSTNCAERGVKNLAAYAASKGALNALTRQLAVELAPWKIRVNTFAPGPTQVERNLRDDPHYDRHWGAVVPLGRTARPEEMVGAAVFLASDDSAYMTGQVFCVDGGWAVAGKISEANLERALVRNVARARRAKS